MEKELIISTLEYNNAQEIYSDILGVDIDKKRGLVKKIESIKRTFFENIDDFYIFKHVMLLRHNPNCMIEVGEVYSIPLRFFLILENLGANLYNFDDFCTACAFNHIYLVKYLTNDGISININEYGNDGFTPLMLAASVGSLDTLKYLLELGADTELVSKNQNKDTALLLAIREHGTVYDDYRASEILIEQGANPYYYNSFKESPSILLKRNSREDLLLNV